MMLNLQFYYSGKGELIHTLSCVIKLYTEEVNGTPEYTASKS